MEKSLVVEDFTGLCLKIYTIGYPTQGECIVCVLWNRDRSVFSFVVDSYCTSGLENHVACELLDSLGVDSIDMFIWTHPDKDHSVGIEYLLDTHDIKRNAEIFISDGIIYDDEILRQHALAIYEYLQSNYKRKQKLNKVSLFKRERRVFPLFEIQEAKSGKKITCELFFVAPMSNKIISQEFNKTKDYNSMSIMFALSLNKINYLFCGDVKNTTLNHIDQTIFQNVKFIKIPHHGSDSSLRVIDYLKMYSINDAVAVTTVFRKNDLPRLDVIDKYKPICKSIYSTSTGTANFGLVQLDFDVLIGNFVPVLNGNAIQFPNN